MSSDGSATSGKPGNYVTLDGAPFSTSGDAAPAAVRTEPPIRAKIIGDRMEDGTIYAGVSPNTGRKFFVTPKDASGVLKWGLRKWGVLKWKAAMKYAAGLDAHGHKDWRLPSQDELDVLYQNRDKGVLKGTFNESGWYWSATENPFSFDLVWRRRFSDGFRSWKWKDEAASVRPVRSEPSP